MLQFDTEGLNAENLAAEIRVIGVGGGGCNAVNRMIEEGVDGVTYLAVNTDKKALENNKSENKLQIGVKLTGGRGAGANPKRDKRLLKKILMILKNLSRAPIWYSLLPEWEEAPEREPHR